MTALNLILVPISVARFGRFRKVWSFLRPFGRQKSGLVGADQTLKFGRFWPFSQNYSFFHVFHKNYLSFSKISGRHPPLATFENPPSPSKFSEFSKLSLKME